MQGMADTDEGPRWGSTALAEIGYFFGRFDEFDVYRDPSDNTFRLVQEGGSFEDYDWFKIEGGTLSPLSNNPPDIHVPLHVFCELLSEIERQGFLQDSTYED